MPPGTLLANPDPPFARTVPRDRLAFAWEGAGVRGIRSEALAPAVVSPLAYVLMGSELGAFGPAIGEWMRDMAASPAVLGMVFTASSVGSVATTLGYAPAVARWGLRAVLAAGAGLFALGLAIVAAAGGPELLLAGFLAAGAGFGALDSGINHLYVRLFPGARAVALNLVHLFFAVGAAGAPVTLALLLPRVGWRAAYGAMALAALALAAALLRTCRMEAEPGRRQPTPAEALRWVRAVAPAAAAIALYVGVEVTVSGWAYTFLAREAGASAVLAGSGISLFWAGLALGRLLLGPAVERAGYRASLLTAAGLAGLSLLAATLPVGPAAAAILLGGCGLAMSVIFPTLMALASTRVPASEEATAAATSVMLLASSVGNMSLPALAGAAAARAGLGPIIAAMGAALPLGFAAALGVRARPAPHPVGVRAHESVRASRVPVRRARRWASQSPARPPADQRAPVGARRPSTAPGVSAPKDGLQADAEGLKSRPARPARTAPHAGAQSVWTSPAAWRR